MLGRAVVVSLAIALLLPAAIGMHTPPALDKLDAGKMGCRGKEAYGVATDSALPILRVTDNGHVILNASAEGPKDARCEFKVVITGYATPGGVNPQGGLANVVSTPCYALGSCWAIAEADWWVTFADPVNGIYTPQIDIFFDLVVNGVVVDSGVVHIADPSAPRLALLEQALP